MKLFESAIFLFIIALSALATSHVKAQEPNEINKGSVLAREVCGECHAIVAGEIRSPNPSAPRFEAIARIPGMTAIALRVALQTSHRTMPNLLLDGEELKNIVAYILSLK